ncbi:pirin family protein [Flavisolibacter sp. BT320]|nr:pirin family protein [Flavisolibacter longurius]
MRTVKAVHKAIYEPIGDLVTYKAMPTESLPMNALDPFIFLNHHGWQEYLPKNRGLPFGPHPHRGFETVTFILEGDLTHKDSSGANSTIRAGGVQWMTAGKGLIHAEVSSEQFKNLGGPLEILQLWVNLPAKHKLAEPAYTGLQKEEIPSLALDGGKVTLHPVSGDWKGTKGPVQPLADIYLSWIDFKEGGETTFAVPTGQNIFFYVVKGEVTVNGTDAGMLHTVEFEKDGEEVNIQANTDAVVLFGYATPFNEPLAAYGPFVMNTREEVMQAYDDFNKGLFGKPEDLL